MRCSYLEVTREQLEKLTGLERAAAVQVSLDLYRIPRVTNDNFKDEDLVCGHVAFRIIAEGHNYTIYDDGRIEGFPPDSIVMNYIPTLLAIAAIKGNHAA